MRKRFSYSIPSMTRRLLQIAAPVKGTLIVSTLASIIGNLAQMGLMGFGALLLLSCTGMVGGSPWFYGGWMFFPLCSSCLAAISKASFLMQALISFWPVCGCICMKPFESWLPLALWTERKGTF